MRRYSDWNGVDSQYFVPAGKVATVSDQNCLVHIELPHESCCIGVKPAEECNIFVLHRGKIFRTTWPALLELISDYVGCKETLVFKMADQDPELEQADKGFLDLLAGSSKKRPASDGGHPARTGPRNEGEVDVGQELMKLMQQEVDHMLEEVISKASTTFRPGVWPCCLASLRQACAPTTASSAPTHREETFLSLWHQAASTCCRLVRP